MAIRRTTGDLAPGRRRWWIALAALPPAVAVVATTLAPSPHGHWTEHLSGAGLKLAQLVVLVLVGFAAWLGRRRLRAPLLVALGVVAVGIVAQAYGDTQVANAIWRTTGDRGFGPGYESGHDTSALGDLVVVVGGLGFAIGAGATRLVRPRVAVLAGVLTIIPPPFFWPAVGVLFVMLYDLTRREAARSRPPAP